MRGFWYIRFATYLTAQKVALGNIKKIQKENPEKAEEIAFKKFNTLFRYGIKSTKTNVIVSGGENIVKEPCVFVGNHQGNFDPIVVSYAIDSVDFDRKMIYIAKESLGKVPLLGFWMKAIGSLFLDRENIRAGVKMLSTAAQKVKSGISVVIFPEGTRDLGGKVLEFKGGATRIAKNAKCKIVPFTIDGSHKVLDVGKKWKGNTIYVTFHEPIDVENYDKEEFKNLDSKIRETVIKGLKEYDFE